MSPVPNKQDVFVKGLWHKNLKSYSIAVCSKQWHFLIPTTTCHTLKQVKQNATNNLALFFRSAFNALSDGEIRSAHCVAP